MFFVSRIKQWLGFENLTNTDLNAEFNNLVAKAGADTLSSANSTNGSAPTVAAMQTTSNPGGVGSENLAATVQQDIQQLRYMLNQIIGGAQWYSTPAGSIASIVSNISGLYTFPSSRVISGRITSLGQPAFVVANGSATSVTLKATATPFVAFLNGVQTTFVADITVTGLSAAPASNNTATINDASLSGQQSSLTQGERGTLLQITGLGTSISALAGTVAAFKVGSTEYFIGEVYINNATLSCTFSAAGSSVAFTHASPTVVTLSGYTFGDGAPIVFTGGTMPGGVTAGTTYYTKAIDNNTFHIAATQGGTSINTSSTGSGVTAVTLAQAETISSTAHGLNLNDQVTFTGTVPTNISTGTAYFITPFGVNAFGVSATAGGSFIVMTYATGGTAVPAKFTAIRECFRGVGFSSADAWDARVPISNGATVTLCKLTYLFATDNSATPAVGITYNRPVVSATAPSSPSIGDYWYDLVNQTWKVYSGSAFVGVIATYIGICIQDSSNCVAARSVDFFNAYSELNTVDVEYLDSTDVRGNRGGCHVSVYGKAYVFETNQPVWNTTANLDTGVTLVATTTYYCYVSNTGQLYLSNVAPSERKFDLLGGYHPAKPWRSVAEFQTDGSTNVISTSISLINHHQRVLPGNFGCPGQFQIGGPLGPVLSSVGGIALQSSLPLTAPSLPATNFVVSQSCGQLSFTSTAVEPLTNLTCVILTTGRPVKIELTADTSSNPFRADVIGNNLDANIYLYRNGTNIASWMAVTQAAVTGLNNVPFISFLDQTAPAGPNEYTLYANVGSGATLTLSYATLVVFEIH
jgi:hypothetical protein